MFLNQENPNVVVIVVPKKKVILEADRLLQVNDFNPSF